MKQKDGTFLPSHIGLKYNNLKEINEAFDKNLTLKVGTVVKIIEVGDPLNRSKKCTEYDIVCNEKRPGGNYTQVFYKNAITMINFGSVADYSNFKLRSDILKSPSPGKFTTSGATVLFMCVNGDSTQNVILGSLSQVNASNDNPSEGHHYTFEFNGANININQSGEYTITHKGPTDIKGNVTDGGQNKSTIQLDKTGNVNLTAPATGNVNVNAGININETANAQIHLQAPNINLSNTQALAIDPILKANAAYVAAFHAKNAGVIAALTATAAALTAEAAAFTALATPLRRLKATGTSYDASSGNGLYRSSGGYSRRHSSDLGL